MIYERIALKLNGYISSERSRYIKSSNAIIFTCFPIWRISITSRSACIVSEQCFATGVIFLIATLFDNVSLNAEHLIE